MSFWGNVGDSFGDLGIAIKHLFVGYSDQEKKDIKKDGQTAQKNIQASKDKNGGTYNPLNSLGINLNPLSGIKDSIDWLIIAIVGLLLWTMIFKD